MTDKQIIIDGVDVSGCPHYIHKDGSCSSHDCECVKCVHNVCFYKDYKAKEQECEELKKQVDITQMFLDACNNSCEHFKQTLTEIKSILELYANSKVGEEQSDGTYQLSSGILDSFGFGFCTTTYDPRPARQALQKISEVEDEFHS